MGNIVTFFQDLTVPSSAFWANLLHIIFKEFDDYEDREVVYKSLKCNSSIQPIFIDHVSLSYVLGFVPVLEI